MHTFCIRKKSKMILQDKYLSNSCPLIRNYSKIALIALECFPSRQLHISDYEKPGGSGKIVYRFIFNV